MYTQPSAEAAAAAASPPPTQRTPSNVSSNSADSERSSNSRKDSLIRLLRETKAALVHEIAHLQSGTASLTPDISPLTALNTLLGAFEQLLAIGDSESIASFWRSLALAYKPLFSFRPPTSVNPKIKSDIGWWAHCRFYCVLEKVFADPLLAGTLQAAIPNYNWLIRSSIIWNAVGSFQESYPNKLLGSENRPGLPTDRPFAMLLQEHDKRIAQTMIQEAGSTGSSTDSTDSADSRVDSTPLTSEEIAAQNVRIARLQSQLIKLIIIISEAAEIYDPQFIYHRSINVSSSAAQLLTVYKQLAIQHAKHRKTKASNSNLTNRNIRDCVIVFCETVGRLRTQDEQSLETAYYGLQSVEILFNEFRRPTKKHVELQKRIFSFISAYRLTEIYTDLGRYLTQPIAEYQALAQDALVQYAGKNPNIAAEIHKILSSLVFDDINSLNIAIERANHIFMAYGDLNNDEEILGLIRKITTLSKLDPNFSAYKEQASAGLRDAKRDIPVPLSPSASVLLCPPSADGFGCPASARSSDLPPSNGSTAQGLDCFARQAAPTSGSSSSLTSSSDNTPLKISNIIRVAKHLYTELNQRKDASTRLHTILTISGHFDYHPLSEFSLANAPSQDLVAVHEGLANINLFEPGSIETAQKALARYISKKCAGERNQIRNNTDPCIIS